MDIELYAHGIPNGKGYWKVPENDKKYIESFYSGKAGVSVPVILEVNVRKSGERTYCYYTYIRTNILDNEGRTGSYFALTVRLDHYYRNIRFLYEFLDDAYNGLIIGNILTNTGGGVKYSIDKFSLKDDFLNNLGKQIQKCLIPWTRKTDFIPLEGFNTSSWSGLKMNLSDGGNERIKELVREKGSISVSPEFPSKEVLDLRGKIDDMEKEASRKESDIRNGYEARIENEKTENEREISKLKQEREKERDKYQELENKLSSIENARKEFNTQCNKILNISTQHLDEGSFERGKGTPHGPQGRNGKTKPVEPEKTSNDSDKYAPYQKDTSWEKAIKAIKEGIHTLKPWVNFILLIAILYVVASQKINGFTGRQEYSPTTEEETSEFPEDHKEDVKESNPNEIIEEFFKKHQLLSIDVEGISRHNPPTTKRKYPLNIITKNIIGGEWTSKDSLVISENQIEAKQPGKYEIIYEVGGIPIASREIEFKEK